MYPWLVITIKPYEKLSGIHPPGLKSVTKDDYDLLIEIRQTRHQLRPSLQPLCLPSSGETSHLPVPNKTPTSMIIIESTRPSDLTAKEVQSNSPDTHVISVANNKKLVYNNIAKEVRHTLHYGNLKAKLLKDNHWTEHQFNSIVAWKLYEKALQDIPRSHCISIMKITHQLWNTNNQNNRYYGHSPICSLCNLVAEDVIHVYTCKSTIAHNAWSKGITTCHHNIQQLLINVLEEIIFGLDNWLANPYKGSYAESLSQGETTILRAVSSQSQIGWESMLRGFFSTDWHTAFVESITKAKPKYTTP
jgi:hypothetical protein